MIVSARVSYRTNFFRQGSLLLSGFLYCNSFLCFVGRQGWEIANLFREFEVAHLMEINSERKNNGVRRGSNDSALNQIILRNED